MNPVSRARPAAARALVVLGMHRSGTSALAGALKLLGLDLGDNLMPPTAFNPGGHFEHADVVAHHERLLHLMGRRWDDLRPLPPRWWWQPEVAALEDDLSGLLAREFGDSELWAVKDPRMCRLLPAWRAPLRALGVEPRFVLVARDPREVAGSLAARDGIPDWKAHLLYLDHLLAAEAATRGRPRTFVTYEELLRDVTGVFERVGSELGLDWSERVRAQADALRAFLHPGLRHHTASGEPEPSRLERITHECYAAFAAAAAGESDRLPDTLEPIAALVHDVVEPWSRGMVEDAERRLAAAERDLLATRDSIQALAREIDASRVAHHAREGLEAELRAALEARGVEVARARTHIESLSSEIGEARRAHEIRDDTEAVLRDAVRARDVEVVQARAHIERLSQELDQARAHIEGLAADIEQARRAHEAREATEQGLRDGLQSRDAEITRLRRHSEALAAVVEEARREHLSRESEEAGLREALADRERAIESARLQIESLGRDLDAERRTSEARERMEVDLLRASRTHQEEARSARESLAVLVRELEAARHAVKERTEREADLNQALSRATAALEEHVSLERELELSLLDSENALGDLKRTLSRRRRWWPVLRKPADASGEPAGRQAGAHFALDVAPAADGQAETTVTGWHVPAPGLTLRRLVARAGARRFPAEHGQPRPDVESAHPGLAGAAQSGFTVRLQLPPGEHRLLFEAEYADGTWHPLGAQDVNVRRPPLVAHVDTPRGRAVSGAVRFAGWCCHPQERVVRMTLGFAGRTTECAYGLAREDVAAVYPDYPGAARSGFEATCALTAGRGRVTMRAHLESGAVLTHVLPEPLVVLPAAVDRPLRRLRTVSRTALVLREVALQLWRRGRRGEPLPPVKTMPRRLVALVQRNRAVARVAMQAALAEYPPPAVSDPYACWLRVNAWHSGAAADLQRRLEARASLPRITVAMAPRSVPAALEMRDTLRRQVHDGWELCLAGTAEVDEAALRSALDGDPAVRVCRAAGTGAPAALNAAAGLATGDFLMLTDRPLVLAPDALAEMALHAAAHPEDDLVYCDHDLLDAGGRRHTPWLKPDWSPELLLSCMYLGAAWMVRRPLFEEVGGYRDGLPGAEDHDFVLRATERARRVGHVPLVLLHDRPERRVDTAVEARRAGARAVREAFARRGVGAAVEARPWPGATDALQARFPDEGPAVTVVAVPRRGGTVNPSELDALRGSSYRPLEVVAAGSGLASAERASRAALANAAARDAAAEYLLFVDAGAVPRDPGWVSAMMGYARLPGVGAVGARIVRPDGVVEHEGVVLGPRDGRGGVHLLQGQRDGALHDGLLARNRSAVSGAGLLTPRRLFQELGGFDTGALSDSHYDLDYGFRLGQKGYRSVYAPGAELVLDRELSAALHEHPQAEACFRRRHPPRPEPFLSPYVAVGRSRLEITPRRLARDVRRLRALMCSFNLNREGAPHVQFELTVRLKQAGALDPVVFCHQDGPLREEYEAAGVEVVIGRHPLSGVFDPPGYERAIAAFADVARDQQAELVYANTVHTFYAVAAAESAGLPSVWNLHESEPVHAHFAHLGPQIAARALECFRYPYRVVFVAEATRQVFQQLDSEHNFAVVPGALDMARRRAEAERWPRARARRSLDLADGEIALLLLGTVCERKGQEDLPLALAGLPPRLWPRVRCFIVGDRGLPYGRRVQRAWDALPAGLRERVAILPETTEPGRFYQAADVFVCTSRVESFPRVTLEAMAHGLPIVTTPVFGIREQVRPGVNALLYEPGDVAALRGALARLLESEALRRELAGQAQPVLDCLDDFDTMVAGYGAIFQEARLTRP